jgi:hypothetical protein
VQSKSENEAYNLQIMNRRGFFRGIVGGSAALAIAPKIVQAKKLALQNLELNIPYPPVELYTVRFFMDGREDAPALVLAPGMEFLFVHDANAGVDHVRGVLQKSTLPGVRGSSVSGILGGKRFEIKCEGHGAEIILLGAEIWL